MTTLRFVSALAAAAIALTQASQAAPAVWRAVDPENIILIEVPTGTIAIELYPEAAPAHAAQVREAVRTGFYDGEYFYRVVEGHVAQGGGEFDPVIAPWPTLPFEAEREVSAEGFAPLGNADLFAPEAGHRDGFAVGRENGREWLLNCPGTLGMARNDPPDSGSTEIFIPLQPRRYLDRNYTIFGRVIDGLQHVHRLPRAEPASEEDAADMFGEDEARARELRTERAARLAPNQIARASVAADLPEDERPAYEVMPVVSDEWEALKHSRRDFSPIQAFIHPPPKVLDICSLPVPVRRAD